MSRKGKEGGGGGGAGAGAGAGGGAGQQQRAFGERAYQSASHTANQDADVLKFDLFVTKRGDGMPEWSEMDAEQCCSMKLFGDFASFLAHEYVIPTGTRNAGKVLACSTVMGGFRRLLNLAKAKFGEENAVFFTCLDAKAKTEPSRWTVRRWTRAWTRRRRWRRSCRAWRSSCRSCAWA